MGISWAAVVARRLGRQGLGRGPVGSVPEAVKRMGGAHAQVMTAAEISVAMRVRDANKATVQDALDGKRTLVKTIAARGTVHLLPVEDLPMWTGALSALPERNSYTEDVRLSPDQKTEVIAAIASALEHDDLTVDELTDEVVRRTGPWAGDLVIPAFQGAWPRWRQVIPAAANAGVLCYGPNRGRNTTYTNPHRYRPFEPLPSSEALRKLLHEYLYAYGPATPQHFARWLSTTPTFVTPYFEGLPEVQLEGERAWVAPGDTEFGEERPPRCVRLLPYFDVYGIGSFPRELLFPGQASTRALNRGQAGNYPLLLVNGVVAGVWHQKRSGRKLHVTVEPLADLTATQLKQLGVQVERLGAIVDATPVLTIGPVSVGPHA